MKKTNPLLLFILSILIFNTSYAQCDLCESSLIKLKEMSDDLQDEREALKDEVNRLRVNDNPAIAAKDAVIDDLNREIDGLAQRVAALVTSTNNTPVVSPLPPTTIPNGTNAQLLKQIEDLKKRIKELEIIERKVNSLERKIEALKIEIVAKNARINALESSINSFKKQVERLKLEKIKLANTITTLEEKLDCIKNIESKRIYIEGIARKELAEADTTYKAIGISGIDNGDSADIKTINLVWDTYEEFGFNKVDTFCTEYRIRFQDDYKTCTNHYNSARMIAYNEGNIINRFGDNLNEKVDNMNERILYELGQAMKKCNSYDGLSDTKSILEDLKNIQERLSELLIIERKASDDDDTDTEITSNIDRIKTLYNQGKFAESIMLYNKFQRLFKLDEFQFAKAKILEAKYCAGTILLWNLEDIETYEKIALKGSWLNFVLSKNYRKKVGHQLLNEVFEYTEDIELKKKTYTVRKKEFVSK